jgi:hypothetical protein
LGDAALWLRAKRGDADERLAVVDRLLAERAEARGEDVDARPWAPDSPLAYNVRTWCQRLGEIATRELSDRQYLAHMDRCAAERTSPQPSAGA